MKTLQYTLSELKEQFAIKINQWNTLYVLNYDQIDSPKTHDVTRECRSLVVESTDGENIDRVVSRAFDRFFNHGESGAPIFNLDQAVVYEKVDGSLFSIFHHEDYGWLYRTRGVIMPSDKIMGWDRTWTDVVYSVLPKVNLAELNKDLTYICEIVCPENRVVTKYEGDALYLLATRNNETGQYSSRNVEGFDKPEKYTTDKGFDALKESAAKLRELKEGYVVYKHGVPLCKVKNPAYVAAHHLKGEGLNSPKRINQLLIMGEIEEYLSAFPEDYEKCKPFIDNHTRIMTELVVNYPEGITDQKEFALLVKDYKYAGIYFTARSKRISVAEAWSMTKESAKLKVLG